MSFAFVYAVIFINVFSITSIEGQATNCPFHLCTPERLKCSTGNLLRDEQGCKICKCEAAPSLRNSTCRLHGCTVNLLRCVGKLKISATGCTLCECDEQGVRSAEPSRRTIIFDLPSKTPTTTSAIGSTTVPSNVCPPVQCENLNCTRLKRSPVTGCPVCQCDDANTTDLCPNAEEFLAGGEMTRAANDYQGRLKYKLFIGRLKKGFIPNQLYKIVLKSVDFNHPFKEFLLEVGSTPHVVVKSRKGGRKMKKTIPRPPTAVTEEKRRNLRECGSAHWIPAKNPRKSQGRVFPDCNTAVMQVDKNTNKTMAALTLVAPKCGCVYVRASLVDYTENSVYLYSPSSWTGSPLIGRSPPNVPTRINQPLYRIICARTSQASKRKKPKKRMKHTGGKVRDSIAMKCCHAAQRLLASNGCDRGATAYAESFTRFKVMQRTCKNAYKECCRLFTSKVTGRMSNRANNTVPVGRHQHWTLDGGIQFPRRILSSGGNGNQNERPRKKKKKATKRKSLNQIERRSSNRRARKRPQL